MVGLTEDLESFVKLMEFSLPRFFKGAVNLFKSADNNSHIRKTIHKDPVKQETIDALKDSRVWKAEMEFYEFAKSQFMSIKADFETHGAQKTVYHYEKIRPRWPI